MSKWDEPIDWEKLVPLIVHPTKVAIIEAMLWIDEPFSAVDVEEMTDGKLPTTAIAYHLRHLALDLSILRLYGEEPIRGAWKKLYFFRKRMPASRRRKKAASTSAESCPSAPPSP